MTKRLMKYVGFKPPIAGKTATEIATMIVPLIDGYRNRKLLRHLNDDIEFVAAYLEAYRNMK